MTRRRWAEGKLHWQFPGGSIESFEGESFAAEREVLEETNVGCQARKILGERVHPNTQRTVSYVLCDYRRGNPSLKDARALDRAEWMNASEVLRVITSDIFPPVEKLLHELKRGQGLTGSQTTNVVREQPAYRAPTLIEYGKVGDITKAAGASL